MEIKNKIAICYTPCGPTYRSTVKRKLETLHIDHKNLHYLIITDDKEYFKGINRKNLIVNELKDFYPDYPHLEKYEYFLESESKEDYAKKWFEQGYTFPFSTNRLHFIQASKLDIKDVIWLGTDTDVFLDRIDPLLNHDNTIYNSISRWDAHISSNHMMEIVNILKEKYSLEVEPTLEIYDAAAKAFSFESVEFMLKFFEIWDYTIVQIYSQNKMKLFGGPYVRNDEFILGPIHNALGIKGPSVDYSLFDARHDPCTERFWATPTECK